MRSVKECLKMGCWTVIKSFHVKIILLDKQELIQEIQVRNEPGCHQVWVSSKPDSSKWDLNESFLDMFELQNRIDLVWRSDCDVLVGYFSNDFA